MNRKLWVVLGVMLALVVGGCSPGKKYERRLERELASGIRHDSLFMGLSLGMTEQEFYKHCYKLNRDSLVKQGSANLSVQYDINEELKYPATMNFYPRFHNGEIFEMPVRFIYNGWAPWAKELSPAKLAKDVKHWYEDIYGKGFITATHPMKGDSYTKVDGNRKITIYIENDLYVWAIFTDLLSPAVVNSQEEETQN